MTPLTDFLTSVDPLDMIVYSLGILTLIQYLRAAHPRVPATSYIGEYGVRGNFAGIRWYLDDLMVPGAPQSYLPDPTKIILVVSSQNVPQAE